jgi:alkylation response protein AidB-like acyl-CoA dehydrogenase
MKNILGERVLGLPGRAARRQEHPVARRPAQLTELAQMGWQAMAVPEEHGGAGYGWTEVAVLAEEMGRRSCAPRTCPRRCSRRGAACGR